jgi:segregation and condensation protein B
VELVKVASGYRFQVKLKWAPWISRLWEEKPQKYSRALLETLALIAYRQPITRGEIEDIRGVVVSTSILKTLLEDREWIRVVGHKEVPGRPALYATTKGFLDYFGLENLQSLPALPEIMNLHIAEVECPITQTAESLETLSDIDAPSCYRKSAEWEPSLQVDLVEDAES